VIYRRRVCFFEIRRASHLQGNVLDIFWQMVITTEHFSSSVNMNLLVAFYYFEIYIYIFFKYILYIIYEFV